MTKGNKQNGRQPPVSQVSAPSTDPRCKNASTLSTDRDKVCRDFIWGICIKGTRCAYRHERDLDHMKVVLKFCHDFQNKGGCVRQDCTYLHTTREEQNQFLNKGKIPKVLADRYAAMAAASISGSDIISQITNGECMHKQTDVPLLMPGITQQQQPQTAILPQLLLQPPPPPPTTKVTTTVQTSTQNVSTTAPPQVPKLTLKQPSPQLPTIFDVTRPPPKLPQQTTGGQKRPAESIEAGPSKARKQEAPNVIETLCDICVQRELRIELLQDDNQKLQTKKDYKALLIEKNNEEYENAKLLMKPLVKPELYQILEEYLEKLPSDLVESEALLQMNTTPSPMVMSNSAKTLMKHLLDRAITNGTNDVLDTQSMSNGIPEDANMSAVRPKADPDENSAVELIQTLLLIYKGSIDNATSDKQTVEKITSEPKPSTSGMSISVISELRQYLNGQNDQSMHTVNANGISPPVGFVSPLNSIENVSNAFGQFQPTVPPPAMRPMFPSPTAINTANLPNTSMSNSIVLSSPTPTLRPTTPLVRLPALTVPVPKPTIRPSVSVRTPTIAVRQPSKLTPIVHPPTPIIPIHPPKPSTLAATPTKQTPTATLSTMKSPKLTVPPPTPARQSTSSQMPVSVQGPQVKHLSTVVQSQMATSPLVSQHNWPAKRFPLQNGKIFIPRNGSITTRPNFLPPFQ